MSYLKRRIRALAQVPCKSPCRHFELSKTNLVNARNEARKKDLPGLAVATQSVDLTPVIMVETYLRAVQVHRSIFGEPMQDLIVRLHRRDASDRD